MHVKGVRALIGANAPALPDAALDPLVDDAHVHHRAVDRHIHGRAAAVRAVTATVTAVHPSSRYGELAIADGAVRTFREKPQVTDGWINGGFFVFEPRVFDHLHADSDILERAPLEDLAEQGELMAFRHDGFWQPMDTIREKQLLESLWESGEAPWKTWK